MSLLKRSAAPAPMTDEACKENQRLRALEMLTHNRMQIGNAPHYNALSHAAGVAAGYLKAVWEMGLLTRDEAIEQNNMIAIAVNCRSPALMMDVVDTRVIH